ncbi:schwannomin-interacting protein 1-like isoform X3 [Carassius carassius]|uniref:schwannomin-interacting protein 1-like isoform X3 n=1 Tax=Carassius carassius TaxID=217509 RepID=UPI0028686210|nr:schwannomin-interacting protein 1-like isoform X3 [Carassius carassius]
MGRFKFANCRVRKAGRGEKEKSRDLLIFQRLGLSERDQILDRCWTESKQHSLRRAPGADEDDYGPCRVPVITSRFNSPKNLQLCFINNSESEDDEVASSKESSCEAEVRGSCSRGLKQEVKAALRALRDKLWAEQKEKENKVRQDHIRQAPHSNMSIRRKILSLSDLQTCSLLQLKALRASLNEDIQGLSSELVKHLVIRDHLQTKQDALLLDVQDMTSL